MTFAEAAAQFVLRPQPEAAVAVALDALLVRDGGAVLDPLTASGAAEDSHRSLLDLLRTGRSAKTLRGRSRETAWA